ncbi:MAG TPA: phasin family protein [Rhodospirillaceae bacterium]|nr:phasin family protein [Rhodospirillaceae bacterium]
MTVSKTVKTVAAPALDAVKQIEEAVAVHAESLENVVKAGAEVATKNVDKAITYTKEQVNAAVKAGSEALKGYEGLVEFNKANIEAIVKSSNIVARGTQELSKVVASLAQQSIDGSVAAGKALIGAKTLQEVIDLSSSLAKANFDRIFAEGSRLGQLSSKIASDAFAPLSQRVEAAVQTLKKAA